MTEEYADMITVLVVTPASNDGPPALAIRATYVLCSLTIVVLLLHSIMEGSGDNRDLPQTG